MSVSQASSLPSALSERRVRLSWFWESLTLKPANVIRNAPDHGVRYFPGGFDSDESIDLILPAPFPYWDPPVQATADGKLLAFGNSDAMYVL